MSESNLTPEEAKKAELLCHDCGKKGNGTCLDTHYGIDWLRLRLDKERCVGAVDSNGILEDRYINPERNLLVRIIRKPNRLEQEVSTYSNGGEFRINRYH